MHFVQPATAMLPVYFMSSSFCLMRHFVRAVCCPGSAPLCWEPLLYNQEWKPRRRTAHQVKRTGGEAGWGNNKLPICKSEQGALLCSSASLKFYFGQIKCRANSGPNVLPETKKERKKERKIERNVWLWMTVGPSKAADYFIFSHLDDLFRLRIVFHEKIGLKLHM